MKHPAHLTPGEVDRIEQLAARIARKLPPEDAEVIDALIGINCRRGTQLTRIKTALQ